TTSTRNVVLSLTYSDSIGISECRYSNDNSTWTEWETCSSTKAWLTTDGYGSKNVYYEASDSAGNTASTYDSIILSEAVYDTTAPINLSVTDDGDYTSSNSSLHASWSAFDRESKVFYLYRVNDTSGNCVNISGTCSLDWIEAKFSIPELQLECKRPTGSWIFKRNLCIQLHPGLK
ncbi:MAG: hypothetical protein NTV63_03460, partial [Candidatus Woesearchaeota archaeon]|nr:hypothetical protein [Candidatus Woesearchaeota archaeon]